MLFTLKNDNVMLDGWPGPVALIITEPFKGATQFIIDALNSHAEKLSESDILRRAIREFYPHRNRVKVLREIIYQLILAVKGAEICQISKN